MGLPARIPQGCVHLQPDKSGLRARPNYLHSSRARHWFKASASATSNLALSPDGEAPETVKAFQSKLFAQMTKFMGPAALIPLQDPIMSLVDTVCIGRFAGTLDLASMGPANMIFSFSTFIWQNLQVATLSLVALHLREGKKGAARRTLATALTLAAVSGLATTILLEVAAPQLIASVGVRDAALVPRAVDYMRVRAWAQPAVLLSMVAQSGMLAQQDSLTPCISVVLATLVSLIGNLVFVAGLGWGLTGAGMTTVATQWVGALLLVWALHWRSSKVVPQFGIPRSVELLALLKTMGPLTIVSLCKNFCYLIVSTTAATLHTLALAAHQAAFSVWTLATWSISPVEQACMAFLPSARLQWQRQTTGAVTVALGCAVGAAAGALLASVLGLCPALLVRDVAVQPHIATIAAIAGISIILVGLDVSCTAINLSQRDFAYVARSYVVTLLFIAAYFAASRHLEWGLRGVWGGLAAFFGVRAVQSSIRAAWALGVLPAGLQKVLGWQSAPVPSIPSTSVPETSAGAPQQRDVQTDVQPVKTPSGPGTSSREAVVSEAETAQPVSSSMPLKTAHQSAHSAQSTAPCSESSRQHPGSQQSPSHSSPSQASSVSHTGSSQLQPQSPQHVSSRSPSPAQGSSHSTTHSAHAAGGLQQSRTLRSVLTTQHLDSTSQGNDTVAVSASMDGGSLSDGEGLDPLRHVSQEDKQQAEAQASVASAPHMP